MSRFAPAPDFDRIVSTNVQGGLKDVAELIVERAASNVNTDTGHYADSLRVTVDDRGVAAESTDFAAHIIEWGSVNNAPQRPLTRAADDTGRFVPE